MARFTSAIDLEETERSTGGGGSFELMPFGDYLMELTAINVKDIDGGTAHEYTYEVIEPAQFAKRRIWDTMMLGHPSNTAWVKVSEGRIASLADSVGFDAMKEGELDPRDGKYKLVDDDVLLYRAFMAKVVQEAGGVSAKGKEFKESNKVSHFYNPTDANAPQAASIYAVQPEPLKRGGKAAPVAANDNRQQASRPAASNDNRPAAGAAGGARTPWGQRKTA